MDPIIQICEATLNRTIVSPVLSTAHHSALTQWWGVIMMLGILTATVAPVSANAKSQDSARHATREAYYLAARQATYLNDMGAAASFYLAALEVAPQDSYLLQQSFATQYISGQIDIAAGLARQMEAHNLKVEHVHEPATIQAVKRQDWEAALFLADKIAETDTARPIAAIVKAWALAAQGRTAAGLEYLLETGRALATDGDVIAPAFLIQAALLAEHANDRATQNKLVSQLKAKQNLPTTITLQLAQMLYRGNNSEAAIALAGKLPRGFDERQVKRFIRTASGPITIPRQVAAGIVDASLIGRDPQAEHMQVAWLSLALYLDASADAARFLLARARGNNAPNAPIDQQLASIPANSIWKQPLLLIQLDRRRRNDLVGAITQLEEVVDTDQDNSFLFKELADLYRFNYQFAKARDAYLTALDLGYTDKDIDRSLAIAYERLDQDDLAERHFINALDINPNDPYTLNYLGYWWADEGRKLDQAIQLIERAVRLRPDSGFFVDSLGWVHFKLGNIDLAVAFLEKAIFLEPADPVITDHLADAYWQAGRLNEARFKWTYALSVAKDPELRDKIQKKLVQ